MFKVIAVIKHQPTCAHRFMSKCHAPCDLKNCKLLILGSGPGGCSVAWRMSRLLCPDDVIVLDPSKHHYFQPLFTHIAGGLCYGHKSAKPHRKVLPSTVRYIQDKATWIDIDNHIVRTKYGPTIGYEYLLIAVGLKNRYDKITGLQRALEDRRSGVSTSYSPIYCHKTWRDLNKEAGGHYVFTLPAEQGTCPAATFKILYLTDSHLKTRRIRKDTSIMFNYGGSDMLFSEKYDKLLYDLTKKKNITVNCNMELKEVRGSEALFSTCHGKKHVAVPFNFLHVTPHMSVPRLLTHVPGLLDKRGYVDVDPHTLQHNKYSHVFGIGDCTNTPNYKTATAAGVQSKVVCDNLASVMCGDQPKSYYDGYGYCTVMTSRGKGIGYETNYNKLLNTIRRDQSEEHRLLYLYDRFYYPHLYWNKLRKGEWDGPIKKLPKIDCNNK